MLNDDKIKAILDEYAEQKGALLREEYKYAQSDFDRELLLNKIKAKRIPRYGYLPLGICAAMFIVVLVGAFGYFNFFSISENAVHLQASTISYDYSSFPSNERVYLPGVLPKGFMVTGYSLEEQIFTIEYGFGSKSLKYSQGRLDINSETELAYMEKISINNTTGYLSKIESGYSQLIWFKENTTFVLIGNIDIDSLKSIAESMK